MSIERTTTRRRQKKRTAPTGTTDWLTLFYFFILFLVAFSSRLTFRWTRQSCIRDGQSTRQRVRRRRTNKLDSLANDKDSSRISFLVSVGGSTILPTKTWWSSTTTTTSSTTRNDREEEDNKKRTRKKRWNEELPGSRGEREWCEWKEGRERGREKLPSL